MIPLKGASSIVPLVFPLIVVRLIHHTAFSEGEYSTTSIMIALF